MALLINRVKSSGWCIAAFVIALSFFGCKTKPAKEAAVSTKKTATTSPAPKTATAPAAPKAAKAPVVTNATVRVAHVFSDNMVLQQNATVPIWGWSEDGQVVTVTFGREKASAVTRDGKWTVKLRGLDASAEPQTLTVSAGNVIQFTNVLVGEVWLASGQSNMEFPLKRSFQSEQDIANATNNLIRWFMVPNVKANNPTNDVEGKWVVSSPENAPAFSAVAYYFSRSLQADRKVPVGIIQSDWGGSPAEVWMSKETLISNPRYKAEILEPFMANEQNYLNALEAYYKERAEAASSGKPFKKTPPSHGWKPTELYNGMIAPLVPYAIKGAIWYQGESNASRAEQYRSLFPDMIRNWRNDWGYEFPFLFVQLAPFKPIQSQPSDSDWAELREAQLLTTKALPKTGMAVITDVGEEHDIHPTKKAPVGERLALLARSIAYHERVESSGPAFKNVSYRDGRAYVAFDHIDGGFVIPGNVIKGFSVSGSDRKFVWALAQVVPDGSVMVWSPNVPNPTAVRYGWADYPVCNLWNWAGLPASPFRTDDFPMITKGKK